MTKIEDIRNKLKKDLFVTKTNGTNTWTTTSPEYDQYVTYIRSDAWRSKKDQYYKLYKPNRHGLYICRACRSHVPRQQLHVHHQSYRRFTNEQVQKDLVALCEKCHNEIHIVARSNKIGMAYGRMAHPKYPNINLWNITKEYIAIKKKLQKSIYKNNPNKLPKHMQFWVDIICNKKTIEQIKHNG